MTQKLHEGSVYSFKLNNRDEIIAKVSKNDDDSVWVDKPVILMITPEGPQMIPMLLTTEEEVFPLQWTGILTYGKTKSDAETAYIRTVTGIVAPTKKIITG
jgi:hypothetical protein